MHAGRKILNLRCDRKISQQELARACNITPSALSKIEAGINSPRASIIWRIAQNLGVTVEYLLDEKIPYPYSAHSYRQKLLEDDADPASRLTRQLTLEESSYLDALRQAHPVTREVAFALPETSVETIRLMHFLVTHSRVENPGPAFREHFENLMTTGRATEGSPAGDGAARRRGGAPPKGARKETAAASRSRGGARTRGAASKGRPSTTRRPARR